MSISKRIIRENNEKIIVKYGDILGCILLSVLFFFLVGEREFIWMNDSGGYTSINISRGPIYQLFVVTIRKIFGDTYYLHAVVVCQNLLAIICVNSFVLYVKKQFKLGKAYTLLILLCAITPFGLETLGYEPGFLYTQVIATEGITYSLFYLFMLFVFKSVFEKKKYYFALACVVGIVLTLARGQMLICLAICGFAAVVMLVLYKDWKLFLIGLLLVILAFFSKNIINTTYQNVMFGATTATSDFTLFTRILYASDEEDEELFEDEELRELYHYIYEVIDQQHLTYKDANPHVLYKWSHLAESYDEIWFENCNDIFKEYMIEKYGILEEEQREEKLGQILGEMKNILMKDNLGQYTIDTLYLLPFGYLSSVFILWPPLYELCFIITLAIYLFAIGIMTVGYLLNGRKSNASTWLLITMAAASINIVGVSAMLFGMDRYLMYTLGIFYMGLLLAMRDIYITRLEKRHEIK